MITSVDSQPGTAVLSGFGNLLRSGWRFFRSPGSPYLLSQSDHRNGQRADRLPKYRIPGLYFLPERSVSGPNSLPKYRIPGLYFLPECGVSGPDLLTKLGEPGIHFGYQRAIDADYYAKKSDRYDAPADNCADQPSS